MKHSLLCLLGLSLVIKLGHAQSPAPSRVDDSFHPPNQVFTHLIALSNGKYLATGDFQYLEGTPLNRIARLNSDGSVDQSFDSGEAAGSVTIRGIAVQPDRKIVVFGDFKEYQGQARHRIVRLLPNGALDETFVPPMDNGSYSGSGIQTALVDYSRGIYISTEYFHGTYGAGRFARLKMDGSLDETFVPNSGPEVPVRVDALCLDNDGRVLAAGVDGSGLSRMRRFLPDGTIDRLFKRIVIGGGLCRKLVIQPHGKILIAGTFTAINEQPRSGVARLHPDGALDLVFQPSLNLGESRWTYAWDLALQSDGRVLVAGEFAPIVGTEPFLVRLLADGSRDPEFNREVKRGTHWPPKINALALSGDGTLVCAGAFKIDGDAPAEDCVRLATGSGFNPVVKADTSEAQVSVQLHPGYTVTMETTSDLGLPWRAVASTNPIVSGVWTFRQPIEGKPVGFYRVR